MSIQAAVDENSFYSVYDAAEALGLSPNTVRNAMVAGDLDFIRFGKRKGVRIMGSSLIKWSEDNRNRRVTRSPDTGSDRRSIDGELMRRARLKKGWSLRETSKRVGLSPAVLSRLENGIQYSVSREAHEAITRALGKRELVG